MLRNIFIAIGSLSLFFGIAWADTLRVGDVYDLPVMYLNRGITSTQTGETGRDITLAPPLRNFEEVTIPAMSGAVFEFTRGGYVETVFASRVIANSSTNVVTLTGTVIRDLCFNQARTYTTCGDPRKWDAGTEVRLTNSSRLYNDKASLTGVNTFTAEQRFGSGAVFTGSGYYLDLPRLTTAERDAMTNVRNGRLIYNKTTGLLNQYVGGSWAAVGTDATSNATTTAAGKVELGTVADQLAKTATGDNGPVVVLTQHLVRSGSLLANNRIPILSGSTLHESIIGTGTTSGAFLQYDPQGDAQWVRVMNTTSLTNTGSITSTSFATGSLLSVLKNGTGVTIQAGWKNAHIKVTGNKPTFAPECTMTSSAGNDTVGRFVVNGAETRCAMYFAARFTTAPVCMVNFSAATDVAAVTVATTNSGMIVTAQGSGVDFNTQTLSYICLEY